MNVKIIQGWTAPIDFQLLSSGLPYGLGAATVELLLKRTNNPGQTVDTSGDITVTTPAEGRVRYTPDPADLGVGSYTMRWKVTLGAQVVFFPSSVPDTLVVYAQ